MGLFDLTDHAEPPEGRPPGFIREVTDVRGVRIVRLHGHVGAESGTAYEEADKAAEASGDVFTRPLLVDFKDATDCDFATVAFLVQAVRRRAPAQVSVGIINAPLRLVSELEIAKLSDIIRVFASEEKAIAALAPT